MDIDDQTQLRICPYSAFFTSVFNSRIPFAKPTKPLYAVCTAVVHYYMHGEGISVVPYRRVLIHCYIFLLGPISMTIFTCKQLRPISCYASRRSRTRNMVKLTVWACVCVCVCVCSSCNCSTVAMHANSNCIGKVVAHALL